MRLFVVTVAVLTVGLSGSVGARLAFAGSISRNGDGSERPDRGASRAKADPLIQEACRGCGCRGGAGYRLANGKCAPRR